MLEELPVLLGAFGLGVAARAYSMLPWRVAAKGTVMLCIGAYFVKTGKWFDFLKLMKYASSDDSLLGHSDPGSEGLLD